VIQQDLQITSGPVLFVLAEKQDGERERERERERDWQRNDKIINGK
jgi:hypothetical protein